MTHTDPAVAPEPQSPFEEAVARLTAEVAAQGERYGELQTAESRQREALLAAQRRVVAVRIATVAPSDPPLPEPGGRALFLTYGDGSTMRSPLHTSAPVEVDGALSVPPPPGSLVPPIIAQTFPRVFFRPPAGDVLQFGYEVWDSTSTGPSLALGRVGLLNPLDVILDQIAIIVGPENAATGDAV